MEYSVEFKKSSLKDYKKLKSIGLDKKFFELIKVLKINPHQTPPPYEKLVGNLKDKYSRRLNIQYRLVYSVIEEEHKIIIYSCWTHHKR